MLSISVKEFLIWKKKQLSKGGDQQTFAVLLDCVGGVSKSNINLIVINPHEILHLKEKLEFIEDDINYKLCFWSRNEYFVCNF